MSPSIGILLALGALIFWGVGDYLLQKTLRAIGTWKTLFFNTLVTALLLLPFVYRDIIPTVIDNKAIVLLLIASVIILFTALLDFEALRRGKLAVIEPILGIEVPITIALGILLAGEKLSVVQLVLSCVVFLGIILSVTTHHTKLHYHKRIVERGVMLACIGAVAMALMNFIVGVSSRYISPLMTIWFTDTLVCLVSFGYLLSTGGFKNFKKVFLKHKLIIAIQGIVDNGAWVFYAFAVLFIPMGVAITISASYIALGVFLGFILNKERVERHQLIGIGLAVCGIILLSFVSA